MPSKREAAFEEWLSRPTGEAEGPVTRDAAVTAGLEHQIVLANDAVTAVLADLERTTTYRPAMAVDRFEGAVRITVNGGYTTPSLWAVERAEAFAEVADYFQDQVGQDIGCWPVCERHSLGLHGEVHNGLAVWWCRRFQHSVAPIGDLGPGVGRRARRKSRKR